MASLDEFEFLDVSESKTDQLLKIQQKIIQTMTISDYYELWKKNKNLFDSVRNEWNYLHYFFQALQNDYEIEFITMFSDFITYDNFVFALFLINTKEQKNFHNYFNFFVNNVPNFKTNPISKQFLKLLRSHPNYYFIFYQMSENFMTNSILILRVASMFNFDKELIVALREGREFEMKITLRQIILVCKSNLSDEIILNFIKKNRHIDSNLVKLFLKPELYPF
jgi:hypothetical protein